MSHKTRKPFYKRVTSWLALAVVLAGVYLAVGIVRSIPLESTRVEVAVPSASGAAGSLRVVQLSDLHSAHYGEDNRDLLALIASKKPDLILATGDMVDSDAENVEGCVNLFRQLVQIAPTVYSPGNHEVYRSDYAQLLSRLAQVGAVPLSGRVVTLEAGGLSLRVGGVLRAMDLPLLDKAGPIDILLCHYPENPAVFAQRGISLVFSGHAHGGQVRIPLLDIPLFAHGEGFFPRYTAGLYQEGGAALIVSRGMGNTERMGIRIPRVFNPPEIIVAEVTFVTESPAAVQTETPVQI